MKTSPMMKAAVPSLIFVVATSAAMAQSTSSITVGVYGGIAQRALTECVFKPFSDKTGIRVIADPGSSAVTLNKLIAQRAAPALDVAYMDGGVSEQAQAAGVLEELDPARVPNIANLIDQARYTDGGKIFAASNGYYSYGIVYNTKLVKQPPASWKDMWRAEFKDVVSIPTASLSMALPFLIHISELNGGSGKNIDPGLAELRKLKVGSYYSSAGTATSMLQSEDVVIAPHYSTSALEMIKSGAPLAFVVPTDKAIAGDFRIHLVKNAPNRAAAEQLINMSLTVSASACLAEKFNAGPAVKDVTLKPEVAKLMPWGEKGSIADLTIPDWRLINAKREEYSRRYEMEVTRQ